MIINLIDLQLLCLLLPWDTYITQGSDHSEHCDKKEELVCDD